jgi:hypothetical protein
MTRRTRLSVQFLEAREAPSGVGDSTVLAGPADAERVPAMAAANSPPSISDFRATVGPNGQVTFTGRVSDDTAVAGYVVRLTGPGVDVTAIVLADGTFQVTTTVNGFTDVTVSAQTTDSSGLPSDPVYTTFTPSP